MPFYDNSQFDSYFSKLLQLINAWPLLEKLDEICDHINLMEDMH
jgi:hypothetical protein